MTRKQAKDASRVAALLSQVDAPLVSLSADAAYDERPVYQIKPLTITKLSAAHGFGHSVATSWRHKDTW